MISSSKTGIALIAWAGLGAASVSAAQDAAPVTVKASSAGFSLGSADGASTIRFRANLAFDGRYFIDNSTPVTADTWVFRNVRPTIEGTLNSIYDYRFTPAFEGGRTTILEAFVAARFKPWLVFQVGKFKGPVGLERLQSDGDTRFIERGFPTNLVPNRELGVQLGGDLLGGNLSYAIGYFDGTLDGRNVDNNNGNASPDVDTDGRRDWEGRLFATPFGGTSVAALRGLGIGIGATYVNSSYLPPTKLVPGPTNTLLSNYGTAGQQTFFSFRSDNATTPAVNEATYADGRRFRYSPQAYYYYGHLGVMAEYARVQQDVSRQATATLLRSGRVDLSAWQITGALLLTGEAETYRGTLVPARDFQPGKSGWGAWELVARYNHLTVGASAFEDGANSFANPASAARAASAYGVGVNWYLNRNFKWMLDYEHTRFDGGAAKGDRPDEELLVTRFYLQF